MPTILLAISGREWLTRQAVLGVSEYAQKHTGWELALVAEEKMQPPLPSEVGAVGAILAMPRPGLMRYATCPEPVVVLECWDLQGIRPAVNLDNHALGVQAARYYLERGFRNLAYVPSGKAPGDSRCQGFRQTVLAAGASFYELPGGVRLATQGRVGALKTLQEFVKSLPKPVGILACNDQHGVIVLQACRTTGMKVPEEVAVLGVHNDPIYCNLGHVPLSSIASDARGMGLKAAEILDAMLQGRPIEPQVIAFPPLGVITRRSTDVVAVSDPQLRQAMHWIANNLHRPFGVGELAEQVGVSRSVLERKFKHVLGRTPHEEIIRQRMDKARELLISTDLSLRSIAYKCGFSGREYFSAAFRHEVGVSPSAFRAGQSPSDGLS